ADAAGIPRDAAEIALDARQRGFRSGGLLRIAQVPADGKRDFLLFMVQRPDGEVYFYLSTVREGLTKAFVYLRLKQSVPILDATVGTLAGIASGLKDAAELFEMARAEGDDATLISVHSDIGKLQQSIAGLEFRRMFSNPLDPNSCFMDIQAGAGGTEAQDWA